MKIDKDEQIGQLAVQYPAVTKIFSRYKIDFCCKGNVSLQESCNKKGLNTEQIIEEIQDILNTPTENIDNWKNASLSDLIDHILVTYHRPLDTELPRLLEMAERVLTVHKDKAPEMLSELAQSVSNLKAELEPHMNKEEQILFPMIKNGQAAMAQGPINVMLQEHDIAGDILKRIRELTNDFQVPENACNTWRALWHGLADIEDSLHIHIHLENNILFPRALSLS